MIFNFIMNGSRIGFFTGNILTLLEDVQALKPTIFMAVPRLLNKIYAKINAGVQATGGLKESLFRSAMEKKLVNLRTNCVYTHGVYDKIVFKKIRAIIGGNVRTLITGSAPVSKDILDFLKCAFSAPIREGYGQTEVCGAATVTKGDDPVSGHVGGPIGCIKIRLRDVPEMGYTAKDIPNPRGEVQFYGPSLFKGYYKDPERTREAFDEDGWLCSGDVGEVFEDGTIKIVDRAKNIFKLSQGEYIAPEKLENIYIQTPLVA
jgi:long-chain acyl-CoA synthetase